MWTDNVQTDEDTKNSIPRIETVHLRRGTITCNKTATWLSKEKSKKQTGEVYDTSSANLHWGHHVRDIKQLKLSTLIPIPGYRTVELILINGCTSESKSLLNTVCPLTFIYAIWYQRFQSTYVVIYWSGTEVLKKLSMHPTILYQPTSSASILPSCHVYKLSDSNSTSCTAQIPKVTTLYL